MERFNHQKKLQRIQLLEVKVNLGVMTMKGYWNLTFICNLVLYGSHTFEGGGSYLSTGETVIFLGSLVALKLFLLKWNEVLKMSRLGYILTRFWLFLYPLGNFESVTAYTNSLLFWKEWPNSSFVVKTNTLTTVCEISRLNNTRQTHLQFIFINATVKEVMNDLN